MVYQLNHTEYKIYQKIMRAVAKGELPKLTKVAEENYVSTTYIVKFAKKLGYSGFSEMIYVNKYKQRLGKTASHSEIALFDQGEVHKLADLIKQFSDKIIFVFGIGYSAIIADYLQKKLSKLGLFVNSSSPIDMTIPYQEYLVIFISKSGETEDVLEIAKKIKSNVSVSLLLTAAADSSIGRHVSHTQMIETEREPNMPDLFDSKCLALFEYILLELNK